MNFTFTRLAIPEVILVEARRFDDERGFVGESYRRSSFAAFGIDDVFVQDNRSRSRRGVLRGLHFQTAPKAQAKLVSVVLGEIFDVAVDLRRGSPHYGRWVGERLSAENGRLLYVPAGFAHGFQVLSDETLLVYKLGAEYDGNHDAGVRWDDPDLGIGWPLPDPVLSRRDRELPLLAETETGFLYPGERR